MRTHLTEEQRRDVLARAEEIQLRTSATGEVGTEIDAMIRAAEEAGLSRDVVLQAIRERIEIHGEPPKAGELTFAKSADGKYYVAEVLASDEHSARVRFMKGGELTAVPEDLKPCAFLPGERVVCPWPDWGWWTCTVINYDAASKRIKVTDGWGSYESFAISEVRLDPPKKTRPRSPNYRMRLALFFIGAGTLLGGGLGAALTWLLMR